MKDMIRDDINKVLKKHGYTMKMKTDGSFEINKIKKGKIIAISTRELRLLETLYLFEALDIPYGQAVKRFKEVGFNNSERYEYGPHRFVRDRVSLMINEYGFTWDGVQCLLKKKPVEIFEGDEG